MIFHVSNKIQPQNPSILSVMHSNPQLILWSCPIFHKKSLFI
uniref:Uncharacterized protein n=1 Tax=Ciona intestinalis TaxID=7719 RepID=H2XNF1_CIOIN